MLRKVTASAASLAATYRSSIAAIPLMKSLHQSAWSCDSPPSTSTDASMSSQQATVNRLMYRARQRGWLELDLLIGMWAQDNAAHLTPDMIVEFEELLDEENPDLFKWLTGQLAPKPEIEKNKIFQIMKREVQAKLAENHSLKAQPGSEWVRGWDDYKKTTPKQ